MTHPKRTPQAYSYVLRLFIPAVAVEIRRRKSASCSRVTRLQRFDISNFIEVEAYSLQVLRGLESMGRRKLEFEVVVDKTGRGLKIEKAL